MDGFIESIKTIIIYLYKAKIDGTNFLKIFISTFKYVMKNITFVESVYFERYPNIVILRIQ